MAGRMSIHRYLKPIDGLPNPKGSLSTTIPSAAIASANPEDRHLAEFGLRQQAIALSSMLTARSLNACTIYGACIIIYCVKLFSFNFFRHFKFFQENLLDENQANYGISG